MLVWPRLTAVTLATLLATAPSLRDCAKKTKKAAPQPTTIASASASASAAPLASVATTTASAVLDAGPPPNTAMLEKSRLWLADLKTMIAKKSSSNPRKDGDGDAASTCESVESARAALATVAEPEYRSNVEEAEALCAFDVPLLTASEALDQLRFSPSQASRLLMCNVSRREIDRARAVHPRDARVQRLEGRRGTLCR
jgi:hypothetical protein